VYRERVRIDEWTRDYDKARTRRMRKTQFRRALDLCNLALQVDSDARRNYLRKNNEISRKFRRKSFINFCAVAYR